ncbi:MAG: uroporphyrinogen-III synthase [Saprospiraceae bacterium]|nr:uroporphyrinogen-III synthase [Saprospiraceae bacterium]
MRRIFISRHLPENSSFREKLASFGSFIIQDEPLIDLLPIPFSIIEPCDWIFFSSKNAVSFFFKQIKSLSIKIPTSVKWGAIGLATAKELLTYQITADFSGNGNPEVVGISFSTLVTGKKVLFPAAKNSRESIQRFIKNEALEIINLAIYDNLPKSDFEVAPSDIYVFTSPLNVIAYSKKYDLSDKNCLAIGETTAQQLKYLGAFNVIMSPFTTEESMAQSIIDFSGKKSGNIPNN